MEAQRDCRTCPRSSSLYSIRDCCTSAFPLSACNSAIALTLGGFREGGRRCGCWDGSCSRPCSLWSWSCCGTHPHPVVVRDHVMLGNNTWDLHRVGHEFCEPHSWLLLLLLEIKILDPKLEVRESHYPVGSSMTSMTPVCYFHRWISPNSRCGLPKRKQWVGGSVLALAAGVFEKLRCR